MDIIEEKCIKMLVRMQYDKNLTINIKVGIGTRWAYRFGGKAILDEQMTGGDSIVIRSFSPTLRHINQNSH